MIKHIALLGSTGIVMGLVTSLVGLPVTVEPLVWLGFYLGWVVFLVKVDCGRAFTTAVVASVLTGLLCGSVQIALFAHYASNNPWYSAELAEGSRVMFLVQGLVAGLIFGVVFGGIAWFILRRRRLAAG